MLFRLGDNGDRMNYWTYFPGTSEPQSMGLPKCCGSDSTYYYVTDAVHNTVAILQSVVGSYLLRQQDRYGPFGDSRTATTPGFFFQYYKGATLDPDVPLSLMGARYYDPDVGRFISEDPIGLKGGINLYAFAGNDPVNGYDPSGMGTICVGCIWRAVGPSLVKWLVDRYNYAPMMGGWVTQGDQNAALACAGNASCQSSVKLVRNGPYLREFKWVASLNSPFLGCSSRISAVSYGRMGTDLRDGDAWEYRGAYVVLTIDVRAASERSMGDGTMGYAGDISAVPYGRSPFGGPTFGGAMTGFAVCATGEALFHGLSPH
jgi:RHS repeat-associated protein